MHLKNIAIVGWPFVCIVYSCFWSGLRKDKGFFGHCLHDHYTLKRHRCVRNRIKYLHVSGASGGRDVLYKAVYVQTALASVVLAQACLNYPYCPTNCIVSYLRVV